MSLQEQLYGIAEFSYPSTKQEIADYYKEHGMSMAQLGRDLAPFSINPRTGAPYQARSLERDFNPDRIDKPTKTAAKKLAYEEFGKTLSPKISYDLPFNVKFKGKLKVSKGWVRNVQCTVQVTPQGLHWSNGVESYTSPREEMVQFLRDGWEGWLFLTYFKGDDLVEDWDGTFTIE